ncbi:MAG: M48 family metalloprotease, partial [Saprospiraceae bacterium]
MTHSPPPPPSSYERQTWVAVGYMAGFLLTYLAMLLFAFGLAALCLYGAVAILNSDLHIFAVLAAIGLSSTGFIVLSFLLKFLFKEHRVDRSGLYEIKKEDEPQLFELLGSLAREIGTRLPRRVYLSAEVNAAVLYDFSFWSLFLPVRKDLSIGLGLVNALTKEEFRYVLAHEFGHFSQKTVRLNQYAYHFDHIAHHLLYDHEPSGENVRTFAQVSMIFNLFATIALNIVAFMKEILKDEYLATKKASMGLSREMEFHADAVAVQVAGVEASKNALLRISFADRAYQSVFGFYQQQVSKKQKGKNLFADHSFALRLLEDELGLEQGGAPPPDNPPSQQRLYVEDPWSSHPSTEARMEQIEKNGKKASFMDHTPAGSVFVNLQRYEEYFTNKLFPKKSAALLTAEESQAAYREYFYSLRDPKVFMGYYAYRSPRAFDLNAPSAYPNNSTLEDLFSHRQVWMASQAASLQEDIERLEAIQSGERMAETFAFNGVPCTVKDCPRLIAELTLEWEILDRSLADNDQQIFHFFKIREAAANRPPQLADLYGTFFAFDQKYQRYSVLLERFSLFATDSTIIEAKANVEALVAEEGQFKADIRETLDLITDVLPQLPQINRVMERYLKAKYPYLDKQGYIQKNVELLAQVLSHYPSLLLEGRAHLKRKWV